ncbi:palmitoyltransferase Hip14-like isoform X2 [Durio zibethinus]|nr:palmitoyltransferase Hip14-like isoform X2 [Durio zibethinus]
MVLLQLHDQDQRKMLAWSKLIGRGTISCISVLLTQFALFLVPLFFSASPILIQLILSALVLLVVMGFGGWCRRLLGFHASAPAFVFCCIFFVWGVYIAIVRQAISCIMDIMFNGEMIMLIIGLCRIMLKDPGYVAHESFSSDELDESSVLGVQTHNESSLLQMRVRYCKSCKTHVQGFDHHCPAFGNCIGQKNYVLFMVLLVGFITTETFYVVCSSQFASKFPALEEIRLETNFISIMARSTLLFSLLQVLWQGLFFIWHVYCICFNIRTEEWVNWKKYPEFQLNASSLPVLSLGTVLVCGCKVSIFSLAAHTFRDQLEGDDYSVRNIRCVTPILLLDIVTLILVIDRKKLKRQW